MNRLTLSRLVTAITFIALAAMAVRTAADTDMYWHLLTGRYILQTRAVPLTDPFSWTAAGTPWVDVHWLSQIGLYATYAAFGQAGLSLLVAGLVVLAFALVWKQLAGGPFLRAFVVVLAAAAAGAVWTPRSQMATFVLTPLTAYVVYLYKWKQIDRLWVLPVIFAVWVNLHGGYIAGFMVLGAVLAGEAANHLLGFEGPEVLSGRRWRKVLIVTLVSGAALLINPYTTAALELPFRTVNIGVLQDFIQEWQSPNFHELFQQPMVWLLLLTLVVVGWSGRRLDATDAALVVVFAYITFLARRNVGLFALVTAPVLCRHAAALWQHSRWGERSLSRGRVGLNWLILGLVGVAAAIKMVVPLLPTSIAQAEAKVLPAKAADWMATNRPPREMFNSYNWGGYLLWRLWPDYPVYADGRTDVYAEAGGILTEYLSVATARPGFEATLTARKVGCVIIEVDSPLDIALKRSSDWREAYRDDMAVIYVRP